MRVCPICNNPKRKAIDRAIMRESILAELRGGPKVDITPMSGYELVRAFDPPKPAETAPACHDSINIKDLKFSEENPPDADRS